MFIFLDTETTGTAEKDRLCQLAYKFETGKIVNELFKPPLPIAIEAMRGTILFSGINFQS